MIFAALLAGALAASATDAVRVPYGDLDFTSREQAMTFAARVDAAAQDACAMRPQVIASLDESRSCAKDLRSRLSMALPSEQRELFLRALDQAPLR